MLFTPSLARQDATPSIDEAATVEVAIAQHELPEPATVELRALPGLPNLNQRLMPRFRPPTSTELAETLKLRAVRFTPKRADTPEPPATRASVTNTPTQRRGEPLRFCVLCGAAVMPWRAVCGAHDQRQGRGLPPPLFLLPVREPAPDLTEVMTALQPIIPPVTRHKRTA